MQSSHAAAKIDIGFDDPNLIADAGLVPVVALAQRVGLPGLVTDRVKITDAANSGGANAAAKVMSLLAGMVAGADSIADTDRLRLAAMEVAFGGVRAPSTLGTFLRSFTHGHVRQLHSVHRQVLAELAATTPLLPGADVLAFVDVDSTHRQVFGYGKQGAAVGRLKGVKTLHPLLATISTPIAAPVIAGIRLRKGKSADVRGASALLAEALATAREAGAGAAIVVRADSKFYTADFVATAGRAGAYVSITTGSNREREQGDRRHRRGGVDADPLPRRLRRSRHRGTGLRRRGRRDRLCGVRGQTEAAPRPGQADRAPRQTPQPQEQRAG